MALHVCVSKPTELEKSRNKSGVILPIARAAMGSVLFDIFEIGDAITVCASVKGMVNISKKGYWQD